MRGEGEVLFGSKKGSFYLCKFISLKKGLDNASSKSDPRMMMNATRNTCKNTVFDSNIDALRVLLFFSLSQVELIKLVP
jgi:hypothetical protein